MNNPLCTLVLIGLTLSVGLLVDTAAGQTAPAAKVDEGQALSKATVDRIIAKLGGAGVPTGRRWTDGELAALLDEKPPLEVLVFLAAATRNDAGLEEKVRDERLRKIGLGDSSSPLGNVTADDLAGLNPQLTFGSSQVWALATFVGLPVKGEGSVPQRIKAILAKELASSGFGSKAVAMNIEPPDEGLRGRLISGSRVPLSHAEAKELISRAPEPSAESQSALWSRWIASRIRAGEQPWKVLQEAEKHDIVIDSNVSDRVVRGYAKSGQWDEADLFVSTRAKPIDRADLKLALAQESVRCGDLQRAQEYIKSGWEILAQSAKANDYVSAGVHWSLTSLACVMAVKDERYREWADATLAATTPHERIAVMCQLFGAEDAPSELFMAKGRPWWEKASTEFAELRESDQEYWVVEYVRCAARFLDEKAMAQVNKAPAGAKRRAGAELVQEYRARKGGAPEPMGEPTSQQIVNTAVGTIHALGECARRQDARECAWDAFAKTRRSASGAACDECVRRISQALIDVGLPVDASLMISTISSPTERADARRYAVQSEWRRERFIRDVLCDLGVLVPARD